MRAVLDLQQPVVMASHDLALLEHFDQCFGLQTDKWHSMASQLKFCLLTEQRCNARRLSTS